MRTASALFVSALCLLACAEGGSEDRIGTDVRISASHHMFGFRGEASFPEFPIKPENLLLDRAILIFDEQGEYRVQRPSGTSSPLPYDLAETGALVLVAAPPTRNTPSVRFPGAYGLEGDTGIYFFLDDTPPKVGMFWGTRLVAGKADLEGDWHVFTLHAIVPDGSPTLNPHNVGRAMAGSLKVDADGNVTEGTAEESTGETLELTGTVSTFEDGGVDVTLTLESPTEKVQRVFRAGAAVADLKPPVTTAVLGTDEDRKGDEAVGLVAMIRKQTGPTDPQLLEGEYWLGLHTLFLNPGNAGTEAGHGSIVFSSDRGFRLSFNDARNRREPIELSGTYELSEDGTLRMTVSEEQEEWLGAVDQQYRTVAFVDHDPGAPSTPVPELNLFLALRKKEPEAK